MTARELAVALLAIKSAPSNDVDAQDAEGMAILRLHNEIAMEGHDRGEVYAISTQIERERSA